MQYVQTQSQTSELPGCDLEENPLRLRPRYGLIKYADKILVMDYTPELETDLLDLLDAIREDGDADDVPRSHNSAARCRACGFWEVCEERVE